VVYANCQAGSTSLTSSLLGAPSSRTGLTCWETQCFSCGNWAAVVASNAVQTAQIYLPCYRLEALLFGGWKGEVWVQPGKEPTQVRSCSLRLPAHAVCRGAPL
jgi:hypothetical protein